MEIKIYTSGVKTEWDNFVRESKNGTFLFYRDFIEYHGNRFNDYSLLFYEKGKLVALMPGHIEDKVFYSHRGLTYGGLIMNAETKAKDILSAFEYLTVTFRHQGIKKIVYKAIPHIYHSQPAEEDLYALFRYKASITASNISSAIYLPERIKYSELRRRGVKKAAKNGLTVSRSEDYEAFWPILSANLLERYDKQPVHTLDEITYLNSKFPDNIHLFTVQDTQNKVIAGCLIFETHQVAHIQYIAASDAGKAQGATDLLVDHIVNTAYPGKKYFDYGVSTENGGEYLNESLIHQKEGFGARGIVYNTYTINLQR
ncbi:GNAT family N-acetyltransferase [Dysgonomonas sp. 521]|uniref:GNAT family N-acetyltransferase n=1 Tax=Dysgonomonas sp. 521 TaxID=2302932 RepID=UPI0013D2553E|nr:GNAT family N-acetyltransferase [Dysgonomonas sp. 521]NDV94666.1 GNAT family N-acetyltransferase [Dysgonomonas sp. 521]